MAVKVMAPSSSALRSQVGAPDPGTLGVCSGRGRPDGWMHLARLSGPGTPPGTKWITFHACTTVSAPAGPQVLDVAPSTSTPGPGRRRPCPWTVGFKLPLLPATVSVATRSLAPK